ncbi:MAG: hypothetical protein EXR65_01955 [Dehalococcoidia bacterium]|nr:hypothetical protein [Dehalococcoidia bacterium]
MALIAVAGSEAGAGATTVAVGLAHRLAYAGRSVRLARLAGDAGAAADARAFAALEFATASGQPVAAASLGAGGGDSDTTDTTDTTDTIVELPAGTDAPALARQLGATLVTVSRTAAGAGGAIAILNHAARGGALAIPEDRVLAAPTVGALIAASRARVLARSAAGDGELCEHIVIGPISEDADTPHFRRFPRKAVVTRAEKVDIALAALLTDTRCLILTGGADPSPYLLDRVASDRTTTLLLAPGGTVETVHDIEGSFGRLPFAGEEKAERIGALMAAALDDAALGRLLGA